MIVISDSIVLSPGLTRAHPIIGYNNKVTTANLAASASADDYPYLNLANPFTHLRWRGVGTGDHTLTHTTGGASPYGFCGIAGHNFGSAGWSVAIKSDTGSGYVDIISASIPGDDRPLLFWWTNASAQSLRVSLSGGSEAPQAAVLFFGEPLIVQRKVLPPHTPINMGRKVNATSGQSQSGNFLGSIVTGEGRSSEISFENLTDDWYRENMDEFVEYATMRNPFFYAWLPETFPQDVGYAWCTNDPKPVIHRANGMMQISLSVDGVA